MRWTVAQGLQRLPGPPHPLWPQGARFASILRGHDLELELYAPRGSDPQQPHTRDELYFIAAGRARFEHGGSVCDAVAGDALFVPAGQPHRFVDISPDFATWVVFFGPEMKAKP